ncbi:MAG: two-component sensor histidine kinase [Desulfovibrionaceae bacterium]|nr:two-component sensor histidine kinase [Desulfovibrionaceae bacterium]
MQNHSDDGSRPLQFVRVISWTLLVIILSFSLLLSLFISKYAEQTLLEKQEQFALLLAENVSHQLFTRFVVPTLVKYRVIQLRSEEQAKVMDQVIRSTVHGFNVSEVRIYDERGTVIYSFDKSEVGKHGNADRMVQKTWETEDFSSEILARISKVAALFRLELDPGDMTLRAYSPLRAERSLTDAARNPIMGILEFKQDITEDYMAMVNFERLIIAFSLLTSLILFFLVLTVLRRAERLSNKQLREKEKLIFELQQQEKLAGMGRMVAGVAHEIRNPLGIICSSSELVLKKARKEGSSNIRILEALYEEARRLSRTVTEFLDYARPKKPAMTDLDVGAILDQVAVFMEPECEKLGVVIDKEFTGDMAARGDKDLLYRAFYNLVANALQAMGGEGELTIRAARGEEGLHVTIVDTGPGFSPEHLDRVRDPFFTTKDSGTGLGLALVNTIFESHGIVMHLSNAEGGGARVDVIFPG